MPVDPATLLALQGLGMFGQAAGAGLGGYFESKEAAKTRRMKSKQFQQQFDENSRQFDEAMEEKKLQRRQTGQQSAISMLAALDKMGRGYGHLGLLQNIGA
jgi:hypothetical protein